MRDGSPFGPLHASLPDHPKTWALADALKVDRATAVGHVAVLWARSMTLAPDGDLSRFTAQHIAEMTLWRGDPEELLAALQSTGWIDGMMLHDHDLYCGYQLEKVEKERKRGQARRDAAKAEAEAEALDASADETEDETPDEDAATPPPEEKRSDQKREEENPPPPTPPASGGAESDPSFAPISVDELLDDVSPETGFTLAEEAAKRWPSLDGFEGRPTVRETVTAALKDNRGLRRANGDLFAFLRRRLAAAHDSHRVAWAYEQNADELDTSLTPDARERVRARKAASRRAHEEAQARLAAQPHPVDSRSIGPPGPLSALIDTLAVKTGDPEQA